MRLSRGFTLVEMIIIAPVVILAIGAFIATVINMTGEVMSSRGANTISYELQDTLNRIEQDVKLSTTFLAQNSISFSSSNPQGLGDGTENFTNIDNSGNAVLILSALATNGNPLSEGVGNIYLNEPETCASGNYPTNRPLLINIVYFVDEDGTMWRRTIMPTNYTSGDLCGGTVWQQPSCSPGTSHSYCKTDDIKLIEGVSSEDFKLRYFASALEESEIEEAVNPSLDVSQRGSALNGAQSLSVSLTSKKTIAGRDISRTGDLRITRLDTNATSVAEIIVPDLASTSPTVTSRVVDGNDVIFEWNQLPGAESYTARYKINGASSWTNVPGTFSNTNRSYKLTTAFHGDSVEFEVRGRVGTTSNYSAYGSSSLTIPVWTPLPLLNGWTTYNNTYSPASYTQVRSGMVMVRGMIKGGTTTQGTPVVNLPAKYRPSKTLLFTTTTAANVYARLDVLNNGNIILNGANFSATWTSLDTIRFIPASVTNYTWTTASLSGGFSHYSDSSGSFEQVRYLQDSVGRVHFQGLARSGNTLANGNLVASVPANLRPSQFQLHTGNSTAYQHLGVNPNTGIETRNNGTVNGHSAMNMRWLPNTHTGWSNLCNASHMCSNGWIFYGSSFTTPQYSKTSDNVVNLKGLLKSGTTTAGTVMATLPANCRPHHRLMYSTASANAHTRIEIAANGQILFTGGSNSWMSLDNITFPASQSGPC